ncbi:hypothetical protein TRAPUB_2642 [Trametes pubescens]|uniref:Uncharacterized protein n=1 Tax=Trametes pubescens TaxID=154538 RepID=A0A1M2VG24_TRAPU|nr:hypothetical protein TRAPUB_2642 [Trametes pubescens]
MHTDRNNTSAVPKLQKPLKALGVDKSFITFDTNRKRIEDQDTMILVLKKLGLVNAPTKPQGSSLQTKKPGRAKAASPNAPFATTSVRSRTLSGGHNTFSQQMETLSAPIQVGQSVARHHDSRRRHNAAAQTRNDPYPRFGQPILDRDEQYRSARAFALSNDSRHRHVVGDVFTTHKVKLRDADLRAHYDQPDSSVALYGTVAHNPRRSQNNDSRWATNATSSFDVRKDRAQLTPTCGMSLPSVRRAPSGIEYASSYDPLYKFAHADTSFHRVAGLPSVESPSTLVKAPDGMHVDGAANAGLVHTFTDRAAAKFSPGYRHQVEPILPTGPLLCPTQQVWSPVVPDTLYATANCGSINLDNARWDFWRQEQQWQIPDHGAASGVFASEQMRFDLSDETFYSQDTQTVSHPAAALRTQEHDAHLPEDILLYHITGPPTEHPPEYIFAEPYDHHEAYSQPPHPAIPTQTAVTACEPQMWTTQGDAQALPVDSTLHLAQMAHYREDTIHLETMMYPSSLEHGHVQATSPLSERDFDGQECDIGCPGLQRDPSSNGASPYGSLPGSYRTESLQWENLAYLQAAANPCGSVRQMAPYTATIAPPPDENNPYVSHNINFNS